jgi:hypothetical protein
MFFAADETTNTSAFEPTGTGGGNFIKNATEAASAAINPENFVKALKELENSATQTARIYGQIGAASDLIQETTVESYRNTIAIGATLKDNFDIYQAIGKSLQRNTYLTDEQLTSLVTLQQTTNLTAEEIGKMVTGFQDLGRGTDAAIKSTENLTKVARGYGLNVNTFLKTVGENIKLVNSYGFKDGVDGLGRMVARAQALRMNFSEVKGLAAELLSPEKAIELAATMQTLGGEIGALGDFGQLMYMAENDMEGLQNSIIDAAKSAVMFNEETGEFKITGVEMRRLREQARALGMNYEDLANTAVKAAKEQRVMESLDFTGLNDQQKQLVANLAEIGTDGQIKLNIPGFEDITDVSKLTKEQFEALEKYQETSQMSEKDIAAKSLSIQDEQLIALRKIASAGLLAGGYLETDTTSKGQDLEMLLKSVAQESGELTQKSIEQFVTTSEFTKSVTSFVTGSETLANDLKTSFIEFSRALNQIASDLPSAIKTNLNVSDPINQFASSLGTLTVTVDSAKNALETLITSATVPTPTMMPDGFFPPGTAKVISGPEGSFSLHPDDMVIAGTKLFANDGMDTNSTKNTNVNFTPLKIDINVAGVTNQDFANMMKSNEFTAAVRKQILSGIGSPLGNTTAGYV